MNVSSEREQAERVARELYERLLDAWNQRDAAGFASHFTRDAVVVGFDGSQMNGRTAIESELDGIFADHTPATYVSKVRDVRHLSPSVVLLTAVAGMVPPGASDINPAVNAIQSLVMVRDEADWRIELFQNTPAAFHGRPQLIDALTAELRDALHR